MHDETDSGEGQFQVIADQQQQRDEYATLKAMVTDLQTNALSNSLLTSLEWLFIIQIACPATGAGYWCFATRFLGFTKYIHL